ncbi:Phenylalanine--tRNA ligase beta subunit [Bienertia sinuspersici]
MQDQNLEKPNPKSVPKQKSAFTLTLSPLFSTFRLSESQVSHCVTLSSIRYLVIGAAGVFLSFSLTQNQILKISQEILLQQQVSSRIFNYNSRSLFFKIRVTFDFFFGSGSFGFGPSLGCGIVVWYWLSGPWLPAACLSGWDLGAGSESGRVWVLGRVWVRVGRLGVWNLS